MISNYRSLNRFLRKRISDIELERAYIIAEVGNSHDGSLGCAHAFIDNCATAGADAIKFQTHIARFESTINEKFRVKFSYADENRFDYWQRLEFSTEEWDGLKRHAHEVGLDFLSTPFSIEAVNLLKNIGVNVWKVSSGEIAAPEMLEALVSQRDPIIVSTGMSNYSEIASVVKNLRVNGSLFSLLQCTTMYPTPLNYVGLNVINELQAKFECITGLSDHSGSVIPPTAAIARGCKLLELHVTFDRKMFGPDQSSSLTFQELKQIREFSDKLLIMDKSEYDKNQVANELKNTKSLFGKSLALKEAQLAGTLICEEMLTFKKPAGGLSDKSLFIGKKLLENVSENRLLELQDVE